MEENYFTRKEVAQVYDGYISRNMPFYSAAIDFLGDAVAARFQGVRVPNAIEIGVGSGNLTENVLKKVAINRLTVLDHSREFLRIAANKLLGGAALPSDGLTFLLQSFSKHNWSDCLPSCEFELVLSSFTFDHIGDDHLPVVYGDIARITKTGGIFTLAEKCASNDRNSQAWKSYERSIDLRTEHNRKYNLKSEEEITEWRRHNFEDDQMRGLLMHIEELNKVGFRVLHIGGVPLPPADRMFYDEYYQTTKIQNLQRTDLIGNDAAHGVGILICEKVDLELMVSSAL